jgi:N-sulfoglucosamine sulfohydrolase
MYLKRRELLRRSALAGLGALAGAALPTNAATDQTTPPADRPNILWLIAEDLCPDIGCYGHPLVHTPHLDRLAGEGVRFTHCFSTAPVCSATRSAFMTGQYQTSIGAHQHRTVNKQPLPEGVRLLTDRFRDAGYFVMNGRPNFESPGKTDLNFAFEGALGGPDWRDRADGQPFFALVHFQETHRDFERDPDQPVNPADVTLPPYYPDHPLARRDWADYLECVQVLDRKVGSVLERLEHDGLADNTLVFFFGDHGRPHVRCKQWLYDGGIHIPLIVRLPGAVNVGRVDDRLVSAIDFAPACLNAAGLPVPETLQGQDFLTPDAPSARDAVFAARDRCDETFDRIRCVRTRRFKYIRNFYPQLPWTQTNLYKERKYPMLPLLRMLYVRGELTPEQSRFLAPCRPPEELYDLEADPHETHNLADSEEHVDTLARLRERLDRWIVETGDLGETPEDPRIAAKRYVAAHLRDTRRTNEQRGLPLHPDPAQYVAWWEEHLGVQR